MGEIALKVIYVEVLRSHEPNRPATAPADDPLKAAVRPAAARR
jgi:hypothetical protein